MMPSADEFVQEPAFFDDLLIAGEVAVLTQAKTFL